MDLLDFTVYFWLFPIAVQVLLPLAVSCLFFGFIVFKHVGLNLMGRRKEPLEIQTVSSGN